MNWNLAKQYHNKKLFFEQLKIITYTNHTNKNKDKKSNKRILNRKKKQFYKLYKKDT